MERDRQISDCLHRHSAPKGSHSEPQLCRALRQSLPSSIPQGDSGTESHYVLSRKGGQVPSTENISPSTPFPLNFSSSPPPPIPPPLRQVILKLNGYTELGTWLRLLWPTCGS